MTTKGKTVKLFFEEGNHHGIIQAEMINWTGYIIVAPRTALSELYKMNDIDKAGIYFLVSDEEKKVYVGETMNGINRLKDHDDKKDFWDKLILVQTKDFNLTKTHCSYLEHRCAQLIEKTFYSLENKKSLNDYTGILPRPDISDMEVFLENLSFMLPATGVTVLQPIITKQSTSKPIAVFEMKSKYVNAEAYIQDDLFVIKKGSTGKEKNSPSLYDTIREKRNTLLAKGIFKIQEGKLIVTKDYPTSSSSLAGCYLTGTPISGPQNWRIKGSTTTYKEWEQQQIGDQ
ncbi:GIY-YIG nuclease family protein [Tenacibaculum maritimum]|uniref:GIY-YIG nuclease family protein n=1 Tax=Tenacibaculum maritimum TaxID=107401 RepID=UPI00041E4A01|nr:GIY-YIG nuclease family protein [Tenacibaculum maritimum]